MVKEDRASSGKRKGGDQRMGLQVRSLELDAYYKT